MPISRYLEIGILESSRGRDKPGTRGRELDCIDEDARAKKKRRANRRKDSSDASSSAKKNRTRRRKERTKDRLGVCNFVLGSLDMIGIWRSYVEILRGPPTL